MTKAEINAQRREIYGFYRALGYTPAQARNMRNRPVTAIKDWAFHRDQMKGTGVEPAPAPAVTISNQTRRAARGRLRDMGLSHKFAGQWSRLKPDTLAQRELNMGLYWDKIKDTVGPEKFNEIYNQFKNQIKGAVDHSEFWKIVQDTYFEHVGV